MTKLALLVTPSMGVPSHFLCRSKDVEARAQDLQAQGESSAAAIEALRVELEESRRVLSDLQVSNPRLILEDRPFLLAEPTCFLTLFFPHTSTAYGPGSVARTFVSNTTGCPCNSALHHQSREG